MSKYNPRPRKRRSIAQRAQQSTLTALRMQRRAQMSTVGHRDLAASDGLLQLLQEQEEKLKRIQHELKYAKARENRAKRRANGFKLQPWKVVGTSTLQKAPEPSQVSHSSQENDMDNEVKRLQRTEKTLQAQIAAQACTIQQLLTKLKQVQQNEAQALQSLAETKVQLYTLQKRLQRLKLRNSVLSRSHDALRKRRTREPTPHKLPGAPTSNLVQHLNLKDSAGVILPEVRDLVRELTVDGVSTKHVSAVISHVLGTFGISLDDSISARSVSRIVLEGLLQSEIQIAHEINEVECE